MTPRCFLAVDVGAASGRVVAGLLDGELLRVEEVHRFPNGPVRVGHTLHWDVLRLWQEIQNGLRLAGERYGGGIATVGVDTWGVDFALLASDDTLLANPVHYRDPRTEGVFEKAFRLVPREEIFAETGLQFLPFNTLFQLLAMRLGNSPLLDVAETLLMMPDLFNWMLTGRKVAEFTNATTTQFYSSRAGRWARGLLERFDIPTHFLPEVVPPGTSLGALVPHVAEEVGLRGLEVMAPATHDTGSAVAAVPAQAASSSADRNQPNWCYISSGTWSLMGVEVTQPRLDPQVLAYNFTNEGGVAGTYRVLKNIMGLWLVQESRRQWQRQGREWSYSDLNQAAEAAAPFRSLIEPDDARFLAPGDVPSRIEAYCRETGQPVPEDEGSIVRCALESLAMKYRFVLERLEKVIGGRIETIHVVGGGAQNELLCQLTADVCDRAVLAGPVEATAVGNVLMQAVAHGDLKSVREGRELVGRSFELKTYEPRPSDASRAAYERFLDLEKRF